MVTRTKKIVIAATAIIIILLCGFAIYKILTPQAKEEEFTEYSYAMHADSDYKVHLNENELYSVDLMEENMVYPKSIFGWLEVNLYAEFSGTKKSDIIADYDVQVVVRGYQTKLEEKKVIYEKSFPLLAQSGLRFLDEAQIRQSVHLNFNEYEDYIHGAEAVLMASPSSEAELIFSGNFKAGTQFGEVTEGFNYSIPLPLSQGLFTIDKPQPVNKEGSITDTHITENAVEKSMIILPAAVIFIMLMLIGYTLLLTVPPDEDKIKELNFKSIMRKYGSRMVRVGETVDMSDKTRMVISDMGSMIKISDQLNIPIFYTLGTDGTPFDGSFFIPREEVCYILCKQAKLPPR